MKKLFYSLIILVFLIPTTHSYAQLNVKIGYVPALGDYDAINSILNEYNTANSDIIEAPFSELHFMHGIDVGLRYKIGGLAFEADWSILNRERDVLLYFSQSDSFDSRLYKFGLSSFSLGMDTYFGRFGMGGALYSQKLNISREIGSNNLKLVSERNWAVDLHINLVLQRSNKVSVVAKPYYRYTLNDYDLNSFSNDLNGVNSNDGSLGFYGVGLFFYNGRK